MVADQQGLVLERVGRAARQLGTRPYLYGDRFSAADISVGYALLLSRFLGVHKQWPEPLADHWSRLKARPAFVAAQSARAA